jgi:hypothetical protein
MFLRAVSHVTIARLNELFGFDQSRCGIYYVVYVFGKTNAAIYVTSDH